MHRGELIQTFLDTVLIYKNQIIIGMPNFFTNRIEIVKLRSKCKPDNYFVIVGHYHEELEFLREQAVFVNYKQEPMAYYSASTQPLILRLGFYLFGIITEIRNVIFINQKVGRFHLISYCRLKHIATETFYLE